MTVARQLSLINVKCVLPSLPNMDIYRSFFKQMVFALDGPGLSRIFELAYPFAFDDRLYEGLELLLRNIDVIFFR